MSNDEESTDERFDMFLRNAAQGYNRPPAEVPREAMWDAIHAARTANAPVVVPIVRRPWLRTILALAATLVIGIGIGRVTMNRPGAGAGTTVASTGASIDSSAPAVADDSSDIVPSDDPLDPDASPKLGTPPRSVVTGSAAATYHVATLQHLTQVEALLTSYRLDARDRALDAQMARWARDLLLSTRLLLDSPGGADPQRRRLLEDLELVLVQIVRLSPSSSTEEHDLIDTTLKQADVLTRLRTAIPAGAPASSGT